MQTSKAYIKVTYTVLFFLLIYLILTHSQISLYYALNSLKLWYSKMIPALLPFMILSGIMIRLQLTEGFAALLHPIFNPFWHIRKNVTYAMIMGFLCGFPMGARVTCELLERDMITEEEANLLLAFCNNIGPVYFLSFVIPLLNRKLLFPYLFGMYGLPFLYGLFLRHFLYHNKIFSDRTPGIYKPFGNKRQNKLIQNNPNQTALSLLEQIDDSIHAGIQSILMLGGYMILFNLLNLIPYAFSKLPLAKMSVTLIALPTLFAPVLEITGGLGILGDSAPLLTLVLLPFGGLSCIAQTYSMIRHTNLSISHYVMHKLILTGLTLLYYIGWYVISPQTFLR